MKKTLLKIDSDINLDEMRAIFLKRTQLIGYDKKIEARNTLKQFFLTALYDQTEYQFISNSESRYCFVYGKWFYREDHRKTFVDFASKFEDADVVLATKDNTVSRKKRFFRTIRSVLYSIIWIVQLLIRGYDIYDSVCFLPYLYTCVDTDAFLKEIDVSKYKFIVVYYDLAPDQNYIVQYAKQKGILTMTLQHGIFAKKKNIQTINDFGVEFEKCISDYYLAWNQYTKDEAIKAGMKSDRVIVLGIPRYASFNPEKPKKEVTNCFGVMLNNSNFSEHNEALIRIANEYYDKTGMKYYLRYHPTMHGNEYSNILGKGYIASLDNSLSIKQYTQSVDFTIISSSSVFVDLVFLKHPVFRLSVSEDDTYSQVKQNSFSTVEELVHLYENDQGYGFDEELFKYLCTGYNTINNYKKFFRQLRDEL